MHKVFFSFITLALALVISGCQTSDSSLREQGRSESYVQGFHDGRHSGMKEAGNDFEHYIKDYERFDTDAEYREGWTAGEAEGLELQQQADAIGGAASGAYGGYQVQKGIDKSKVHPKKIAKDVMKDVDTGELKALEK